ncbi:MAG: M20/M25/M40 family metallo-hydrolase [Spirochaetota bacterium]|nr:M20/M25/M40 family metallo-hydrolase [Spirochaetota bacterium]
MMNEAMAHLIEGLPQMKKKLTSLRDTLLTNIVMLGEIPAPTFHEQQRRRFLVNRFNQYQMLNCSTDEVGNGLGIIPGEGGDRNILVVAHLDTVFDESIDHTISIETKRIHGPAVGDNSLGVATLATLPAMLEELNLKFNANLILMGSARSLGHGNIEGVRFFLDNMDLPINAGVCVEGVKLGRLSHTSIGMARCEITYRLPEEYDWTRFGAVGSIVTINELINRILEIPIPRRPKTTIVLGSISGGRSFNTIATDAVLRFEIRSESNEMVQELRQRIEDIAAEVSSHNGSEVEIQILAQRKPGGISFSHPLASNARAIMKSLGINPRVSPSTSELSAFIDHGIPALTLGLTNGENLNKPDENIEIEPIYNGLAQLLGVLIAIDRGYCDAT